MKTNVDMRSSLIVDDSTPGKTWPPKNGLTSLHWSGNAHKVIRGISLVDLLATRDDACLPVDYRVYKGSGEKKNKDDHFIDMIDSAKERGFEADHVMGDRWYGSLENMRHINETGWKFIFGIKENRFVNRLLAKPFILAVRGCIFPQSA